MWCASLISLTYAHRTQTRGLSVCCIGLLALGTSTFWFPSWAKNFARVCLCVCESSWFSTLAPSSSVPLMVYSEVQQWWTVKYFVFFLSTSHSGTKDKNTTDVLNKEVWRGRKTEGFYSLYAIHLFVQAYCQIYFYTFWLKQTTTKKKNRWVIEVFGEVMRQSVVVKSVFKNTRVLLICNNVSFYLFLSE